ncbi:lycopene cyclase family protein [Yonghaparkia sp. Root332]|uniref:lycopene cyclase family protein n=1 Tax=Yonghaparkia sp. Root332 TaxID=1736516 RepID=UPI0006F5376A|nr:lycopene cyclase family protein [Yonghaparkia sp. Root332]KQV25943.1 hypothetical protein ASC54_02980 [Yonghaparkia sp. Root332]
MPRTRAYDADLVILGAGCAGLALAARLAEGDSGLRVIAVDVRTDYSDDRSWCFWADDAHDLRPIVAHEWRDWTYQAEGGPGVAHHVDGETYQYVRGADFYAHARALIEASDRVELRLGVAAGEVRALHPSISRPAGEGVIVSTSAGDLTARWVVDTRPRRTAAMLFQCFSGAEVDHGGSLDLAALGIAPGAAGLMTGMRADADGLGFVYVLPLSDSTALVEWTRFSPSPLRASEVRAGRDAALAALGAPLGAPHVRVLREEAGVLPMGRVPSPSADATPSVPGVVVAGAAGGALRDASGYGFARIQAWARDCADRLARGEAPIGHPPEPFIRRQMDRIFLQALRAHPERTADYFAAMARGVAPARLLRFLTDRARLSDLLAIIASLPLLPFLAQLPDRSRALATSSARRPDLVRALPPVRRAPAPQREPQPQPETADQVA